LKTAILAITTEARVLAEKLASKLPECNVIPCRGSTAESIRKAWKSYDALICIMASGIVVRAISRLVSDKKKDPPLIILDQKGRFVIPLLSGHLGGANELARKVAGITGGQAVITTASDVSGHTPLDLWIKELGLVIKNPELLPRVMTRLVDGGSLSVYSDCGLPPLPHDLSEASSMARADAIITMRTPGPKDVCEGKLVLNPPLLVAGIGCNRGTPCEKIFAAVEKTCSLASLARASICRVASIDLKKDEKGLREFARMAGAELFFFSAEQLNEVDDIKQSEIVKRATGAKGVCEPAAILASGNGPLLVEKHKWKDVTTAIAQVSWPWWEQAQAP